MGYAVFYSRNSGLPYAYVAEGFHSHQHAQSNTGHAPDGSEEKVAGVFDSKATANRQAGEYLAMLRREYGLD